jgi:phage protein D
MSLGALVSAAGIVDSGFPQPTSLLVDEGFMRPATFTLSYDTNIQDGDLAPLSHDALGPDCPVVIQVSVDGQMETLMKGSVLRQAASLQAGGEGSLDVMGADATADMNREFRTKVWNDSTDAMIVQQILGQYGFIPQTDSTTGTHSESMHSLVQRETDLQFVHRLARRNGFWFWLRADGTGNLLTAHFRKPPLDDDSGVTLSIRNGQANVDDLALHWDTDRPTAVDAKQFDLVSLSANDGSLTRSPLNALGAKALADIVQHPRTTQLAIPASDQADLQARAESLLVESGWFVSARLTAKLSVLKKVVRAHSVVTLDGVGARHSGKYLVSGVLHDIRDSDHVMTIDLIRNAWN